MIAASAPAIIPTERRPCHPRSRTQKPYVDAAIRAPTIGQEWRFLLVDDPAIKAQLAPLYRQAFERMLGGHLDAVRAGLAQGDSPMGRMVRSGVHLAQHFADVPLLLLGFGRTREGSGAAAPLSRRRPRSSSRAISGQVSTRIHPAASSIPSGNPSTSRQISTTDGQSAGDMTNAASARLALAANRSAALSSVGVWG